MVDTVPVNAAIVTAFTGNTPKYYLDSTGAVQEQNVQEFEFAVQSSPSFSASETEALPYNDAALHVFDHLYLTQMFAKRFCPDLGVDIPAPVTATGYGEFVFTTSG